LRILHQGLQRTREQFFRLALHQGNVTASPILCAPDDYLPSFSAVIRSGRSQDTSLSFSSNNTSVSRSMTCPSPGPPLNFRDFGMTSKPRIGNSIAGTRAGTRRQNRSSCERGQGCGGYTFSVPARAILTGGDNWCRNRRRMGWSPSHNVPPEEIRYRYAVQTKGAAV